ncbi:MAG: type II/IV secretion system protein [Verrucomicrobia bacterium]|nr:type II/IV secretion system protein [Verrucomicrobiota bacterium]
MNADSVLDLLVSRELIDDSQREDLAYALSQSGKDIVSLLNDYSILEPDQLYQLIAEDIGGYSIELDGFEPPPQVLAAVPAGTARLHEAFPIQFTEEGLLVALTDPLNTHTAEELHFALNLDIQIAVAPPEKILEMIEKHYGGDAEGMNEALSMAAQEAAALSNTDEDADEDSAPIIRYVDLVLFQAIKEQASDIHFEPFEDDFKIRYRVDGSLYEMAPPPMHLQSSIISRIKVMADLNIAETRLPQDGRIMLNTPSMAVDMRVSTLPTQSGESVVLRVLDRSNVNLNMDAIGFPDFIFDYVTETIQKPNGIFICTGPTGAGKTTTLYACLRTINTMDSKLLTAEDPVEYEIDGIIQVPVNEAIGLTFSRVLRAFLRQDPDRILVGEMRDLDTAQIAIQASLTGHLVLSTLHTNDAPGAVTRLVDMGTEPFLVAATMEGVLAQRLLRKICQSCKVAYTPSEAVLDQLGLTTADIGGKEFYTGQGCNECNDTGYKGRQGLFELLDMTDPLRELITERAATVVLRQKALELGMNSLRDDGLRNIYNGITTIEEVLKYT